VSFPWQRRKKGKKERGLFCERKRVLRVFSEGKKRVFGKRKSC
jgi:hypothetical protein